MGQERWTEELGGVFLGLVFSNSIKRNVKILWWERRNNCDGGGGLMVLMLLISNRILRLFG